MSKLTQAFKQKDVVKKMLFTLLIVLIYRIGCFLPLPGIPVHDFVDMFNSSIENGSALSLLSIFSSLDRMSIMSLGIMPYITSSIIMQLMGAVIPKIAQWKKDGVEGRRKITKITRYLTVVIGLINAIGYCLLFKSPQYGLVYNPEVPWLFNDFMLVFGMMIGVVLIMWLGELITQRGIGNGMSVLIYVNVLSRVPSAISQSIATSSTTAEGIAWTAIILAFIAIVIPMIVFMERGQRRIPLRSSKSGNVSRYAQQNNTHYFPIKVSNVVISLILASCLIMAPAQLAAFVNVDWLTNFANALTRGPVNLVATGVLVIFFSFFYNDIQYDMDDVADNFKKSGTYIPGVRPGMATANYLRYILSRVTWPAAIYGAVIAVASAALFLFTNNAVLSAFGGTSILIIVSVSMQVVASLEQRLRASDPERVLRRLG